MSDRPYRDLSRFFEGANHRLIRLLTDVEMYLEEL